MTFPDTVDELLARTERTDNALFWALTDDDEIVACEPFCIWNSEGYVATLATAEGLATKYRVVCEVTDLDYIDEWDDGTPIDVKPGDLIKFRFRLKTWMA